VNQKTECGKKMWETKLRQQSKCGSILSGDLRFVSAYLQ